MQGGELGLNAVQPTELGEGGATRLLGSQSFELSEFRWPLGWSAADDGVPAERPGHHGDQLPLDLLGGQGGELGADGCQREPAQQAGRASRTELPSS